MARVLSPQMLGILLCVAGCSSGEHTENVLPTATQTLKLEFTAFEGMWNFFRLPFVLVDGSVPPKFSLTSGPQGAEISPGGVVHWFPSAARDEVTLLTGTIAEEQTPVETKFEMRVRVKPPSRVMMVVAHQDDDLGFLEGLQRFVEMGVEVQGLWIAGAPNKWTQDPHITCEGRAAESRTAFEGLGIPSKNLTFLCFPDRSIGEKLPEISVRVEEELSRVAPDAIFTLAFEGGHMDHDLVNFLVAYSVSNLESPPPVFEFPLYNVEQKIAKSFYPARSTSEVIRLPTSEEELRGFEENYPSQEAIIATLNVMMDSRAKEHARLRAMPNWDYSRPPMKLPVMYEINPFINPFESFDDAYLVHVERYLSQKGRGPILQPSRPAEQDLLEAVGGMDAELDW